MRSHLRHLLPMRRSRRVSISAIAFLLLLPAVPAFGYHVVILWVLGPTTPKAHSTHGMRFKVTPRVGDAGDTFVGKGRGFEPGEYVTVWEYTKDGRSTQLLGGNASRKGSVRVDRMSLAGISKPGHRKICMQGERTRRVACGNYRVRKPQATSEGPAASGTEPGVGPGYVEPAPASGYVEPTAGPGYVAPEVGPGYVAPTSG